MNVTQSFDLEAWSQHHLTEIEACLDNWIPGSAPANLTEPMKYAVLGGGKRLRSLLVMGAFESGINDSKSDEIEWRREAALRAATAIELIHAIHSCMMICLVWIMTSCDGENQLFM